MESAWSLLCLVIFALVQEGAFQETDHQAGITPLCGCLPCCMKGDTGPPGPPGPPIQRKVAFSVAKTTTTTSNPNQQVVIFDHVFINIGNGYDVTTGVFTCPVGGAYFFTFNALKYYSYNVHVQLTKNGDQVIAAHSGEGTGSSGPRELQHTGNDVIVSCDEGDRLWIKLPYTDGSPYRFFGHPVHRYTSFSGYLIFTD